MSDPATAASWLLSYLTECGVLGPADLAAARVRTDDVSVSHASVRISVDGTPQWFVKRADPVRSRGRDLGAESLVYRLAANHPALAAVIPRCRLADDRHQLVVLEIARGRALDFDLALAPGAAHARVLRAYGHALAAVHSVRPARFGAVPWLLAALEPQWGDYGWLPRVCAVLLTRLARDRSFAAGFARARQAWTATGLIHGDVRWANAIVDSNVPPDLRLVDWELACVGDAAWDVGSVLADIVTARTLWSAAMRHERALDGALTFLSAYRAAAAPADGDWPRFVDRAVRFSGVRLVQNVIEQGYAAPDGVAHAAQVLLPWAAALLHHAPTFAQDLAAPEPIAS